MLSLQSELLSFIKDGVISRDVYHHALSFVRQKDPNLEKHFVKNIGFGVSILYTLYLSYIDIFLDRYGIS